MMFSSIFLVVLVSAFNHVSSEEYVYVIRTFPPIPCIESPAKDICPVDHKIPDLSISFPKGALYIGNKTTIEERLNQTVGLFERLTANESCIAAIKNFICRGLSPVCRDDDDYFEMNDQETLDLCNKGLQECPKHPITPVVFNCSSLETKRLGRRLECEDFPDVKNDPYPCSSRDYKIPEYATREEPVQEVLRAHLLLKKEESKITTTCRDKVADAMCRIGFPACTKDRQRVVSFLTKGQCDTIRECLNVSGIDPALINGAEKWCSGLPYRNATKIKLSDAFGIQTTANKTSQQRASKILMLAFLSYLVLLF